MNIVVNEELKAYIDPLTPDEREALERSLLAEGCRYPRYLVDEKVGKVDKSTLDIHDINVYFTTTPSSTRVLDTGSVAKCY